MSDSRVLADITSLNAPFFDAARRGELMLQRCESCHRLRYPPASICATCLSPAVSWVPVTGRGTIFSWIVMHRRYLPGFDQLLPYPVGLVRLDEGPMLLTRLIGNDDALECDSRVVVEFEELSPEIAVPVFRVESFAERDDD